MTHKGTRNGRWLRRSFRKYPSRSVFLTKRFQPEAQGLREIPANYATTRVGLGKPTRCCSRAGKSALRRPPHLSA